MSVQSVDQPGLVNPTPEPEAPNPGAFGPEHHLRVAPDVSRRRRRARLAVWAATLVTVVSLFALVAFHALAVQQAFALDRLAEQQAQEARRYERLRAEVAELSSPAAIVEAARARGMVFTSVPPEQIEASEAAPEAPPDEQTSDTLTEALNETKPSLGR